MRILALAVGLLSVSVMAQTAPGQGTDNAWVKAPPVVLQKAPADTIEVPLNVLDGLAVSEPNIVVPEGAPNARMVALKVLVSKTGAVEEVAVSMGDEVLRKAAADGVMGWKYRPYLVNGEPREFQATILIRFRDGVGTRMTAPPPLAAPNLGPPLQLATADTITVTPNVLQGLAEAQPDIVVPEGAPQAGVVWVKVLVSKTGVVEEAVVSQGEVALRQVAVDGVKGWKYKPFVQDGYPREIQSSIVLGFQEGVGKRAVPSLGGPIRVSAGVIAGLLEEPVAPVYPPVAKAAHVQGIVVLHAVLSKSGSIESLRVISGPPLLAAAALDAVKRWTYRPYLLNGKPVEVETTINVNFTFAEPKQPDAAGGESGAAPAPAATPDPR